MSKIHPRGTAVMLPHGGLPELFPPYLAELIERTGGADGPIGRQFVAQPKLERQFSSNGLADPLSEDAHEVAPGLVYKYCSDDQSKNRGQRFLHPGRALWTITRLCAAYCRFCTRGREVGVFGSTPGSSSAALAHAPHLSFKQMNETLRFIEKEPGLNEIILSGGDPLTVDPNALEYILKNLGRLQQMGKLAIVRIGTRVPIHNPLMLQQSHYAALQHIHNLRLMLHVNHPFELQPETLAVLDRLQHECGAIIMSQTVLLQGVNDSSGVLCELFTRLADAGVVPYYLFQNDPVYWAKHFTVPLPQAIRMWQNLRPKLSGIAATARFVIDVPDGYGKIPIPEGNAWSVEYQKGFRDFRGRTFQVD